ncbi:AAA family ATPase [Candidatus Micrarchaeota archaeon]|nr:AAA family ATPase [Candidatus Micrarchaeota archaeon]MBD3417953.1 AAA family ATPase [Candidatus Micrarchaeota archaeon]
MPSFDEFISESRIFKDRDVLSPHYIPDTLHFRDHQIRELMSSLAPALMGKKPRNTFIYGKTGTGKTCSVKQVSRKFDEKAEGKARIVYINCRIHNKPYRVMLKVAKAVMEGFDKQGYGLPHIYERLLEWAGTGKQVLIILDEIDMVKNLDELLYMITRANDELEAGGFSVIGISNKLLFKEDLDPRSKSSLYEREMVFPPYTANQLQKILHQRAELGFQPGSFTSGAINLAGAIAAQESGDARYALKILSRAAEMAEEADKGKFTDAEVKAARELVELDIVREAIDKLPENHQVVLYAVARLSLSGSRYARLDDGDDGYLFSGEIYEEYTSLCKKLRKPPKTARSYRSYLNDLEMLGLLTCVESGKGIRGHTKLIKLGHPPRELMKIVSKHLEE